MYPKWGYHATKEAIIIKDGDHHEKLGDGYYDTPTALANALAEDSPLEEFNEDASAPRVKRKYTKRQG